MPRPFFFSFPVDASQQVKGTRLAGGAKRNVASVDDTRDWATHTLSIHKRLSLWHPSEYQSQVGAPQSTVSGVSFGIGYSRKVGERLTLNGLVDYLSMDTDFELQMARLFVGADYYFYRGRQILVGAFAVVGVSSTSFLSPPFVDTQNLALPSRVKTSSIISIPMQGGIVAHYQFDYGFGLLTRVGYERNGLGKVDYSRNADNSLNGVDFNASGLSFSLALAFSFD